MSGLDQMMQRIAAEGAEKAAAITQRANEEAAKILEAAKTDGAARSAEIAQRSKKDCASLKERTLSSQEQQRRTALLAAKQELISDLLAQAYKSLLDKPEDAYFSFLKDVLAQYAQPLSGEICFSARDLARLPQGYMDELQAIAAKNGGSLTLSKDARPIDGGFVLLYGGIEENCTISALFDARREALQDQVRSLLFA